MASASTPKTLEELIIAGDVETITASPLAATGLISMVFPSGNYALGLAALHGNLELCKLFVARGADVHQRANDGATALLLAARAGAAPVVRFLMASGADINERDTDGLAPICAAASGGHLDAVQALLTRAAATDATKGAPLDLNVADNEGFTALMCAAIKGHAAVVKALTKAGAAVSCANEEGATALYFAAKGAHLGVVKALLTAKADPNGFFLPPPPPAEEPHIPTVSGKKAKAGEDKAAGASASPIFAKALPRFGPPIYAAAEAGHTDVVKALVEGGADAGVRCPASGGTALYAAAEEGHVKVVKLLLTTDAVVAALGTAGPDSCCYQSFGGEEKSSAPSSSSLLSVFASAVNIQGASPLFIACYKDLPDVAKLLLAAGANAAERYVGGATCLFIAAQNGHLKTCRVLLEHRAKVLKASPAETTEDPIALDAQIETQAGMTALCVAADRGHYDIAKALAGAGADVHVRCGHMLRETALSIAVARDQTKIAEYLTQVIGQQKKSGGKAGKA